MAALLDRAIMYFKVFIATEAPFSPELEETYAKHAWADACEDYEEKWIPKPRTIRNVSFLSFSLTVQQ